MSWEDVAKLVLAAVFAGAATVTITWLKSLWDEQRALTEGFSKAVRDSADLATGYWLKPGDADDLQLLEARLVGAQTYLSHFRLIATSHFSTPDRLWFLGALTDLFDQMTEGQFKVTGRAADHQRAEECQRLANEIAIHALSSHRRAMSVGALFGRLLSWRK